MLYVKCPHDSSFVLNLYRYSAHHQDDLIGFGGDILVHPTFQVCKTTLEGIRTDTAGSNLIRDEDISGILGGELVELLYGRAVVGGTAFVVVVGGNAKDGNVVKGFSFPEPHTGVCGANGKEDVLCLGIIGTGRGHCGLRADVKEILAGYRRKKGKDYKDIFSFHIASSLEIDVDTCGIDGLHGID
jgi:hypothetical protein